jgi:hypothetical protein
MRYSMLAGGIGKGYDEPPVLIVPEDDPVQSKNGPDAKLAGSPSEGTQ